MNCKVILEPVPITLEAANELVVALHRHHDTSQGHKFSIGVATDAGRLVGAVIVSMPRARGADKGRDAEAVRVVTDGTPNACSVLYGASARAAEAMGFTRIFTFIRVDEPGDSLKAAGWKYECTTKGRSWNCPSRPRKDKTELIDRQRWAKILYPRRRRKR